MLAKSRRKAFAGPIIAERDERFEIVPSWAIIKALQSGAQMPGNTVESQREKPSVMRDMIANARAKWSERRKPKSVPADTSVRIAPEPPKLTVDSA